MDFTKLIDDLMDRKKVFYNKGVSVVRAPKDWREKFAKHAEKTLKNVKTLVRIEKLKEVEKGCFERVAGTVTASTKTWIQLKRYKDNARKVENEARISARTNLDIP